MNSEYFKFLFTMCESPYRYEKLLRYLFETEFYGVVPNDDNRCADGLQIREQFNNLNEEAPCSVLEMLIGLALRLEFELVQTMFEKSYKEWFWILIDNLGLSWATNTALQSDTSRLKRAITRLLDRGYESNGEGGLFPLKNSKNDQRKVEIWYQMTEWVLENYEIV